MLLLSKLDPGRIRSSPLLEQNASLTRCFTEPLFSKNSATCYDLDKMGYINLYIDGYIVEFSITYHSIILLPSFTFWATYYLVVSICANRVSNLFTTSGSWPHTDKTITASKSPSPGCSTTAPVRWRRTGQLQLRAVSSPNLKSMWKMMCELRIEMGSHMIRSFNRTS